jgi:hypothetical protein
VHDYDDDPAKLQARYGSAEAIARINTIQPGERSLALDDFQLHDQPIVISEFGGIAFTPHKETSEKGWGYSRARDADSFLEKYGSLVGALHECRPFIAGFCYTQLTDTYQEKNGLLFMDRSPKADLAKLFTATRPKRKPGEIEQEPIPDPLGYSKRWRQRRKE